MGALSPSSLAEFASRRLQAQTGYESNKAQNQFKQGATTSKYELDTGQLEQKFGLDWGDLARKWDATREKLPGGFAGKGLLNSGIYTDALNKYAQERSGSEEQARFGYQSSLNQLNLGYQTDLGSLALDQQLADQAYYTAMWDLGSQQTAAQQEQDTKDAWGAMELQGKVQDQAWQAMALREALAGK